MIQSKVDYKYYLERDFIASSCQRQSLFRRLLYPNEICDFIKALRFLEYCENVKKKSIYGKIIWVIAKLRFRRISIRLGFSIPVNVFGPGLSLPHRGNIVINPNVKIGKNCRIHVGVNIGEHKGKSPQIGDNVYIGPGAIIYGDVKIANNIMIGANSTVNSSFLQENVVIAGSPAKIVKENVRSWNGK